MKEWAVWFKKWYEKSNNQYKVLVILIGWFFIYLLFSLVFFKGQADQRLILTTQINELNHQVATWENQVKILKELPKSPYYKKWQEQRKELQSLQGRYQTLLKNSSSKQWEEVTDHLLKTEKNLKVIKIKNLPETVYTPPQPLKINTKIYQQKLIFSLAGDYTDTVAYLNHLEADLPNIRWNNLNYQVTNYPNAKIDMEFSILYEKGN
jgi:hypothetical protein